MLATKTAMIRNFLSLVSSLRFTNQPNAMTCVKLDTVPEGHSVLLHMLKVSEGLSPRFRGGKKKRIVNLHVLSVFVLFYLFCLSGIPSSEETMSSLLTVIQTSSQSQLGPQQYSECPVSEWNSGGNSTTNATSCNGQVGSVSLLCWCCCLSVGRSVHKRRSFHKS